MKTYVEKSSIEKRIVDVEYARGVGTITHCYIKMINGFTVIGESACVDPAKFDDAVGRKYAYANAFEKLWALEGYLLSEKLHNSGRGDDDHDIGWAVRQMKHGHPVYRRGWNGRNQFVYFVPPNEYAAQTEIAKRHFGDTVPYNAYFALKTVEGYVSTWVPSVTDTLMHDWEISE